LCLLFSQCRQESYQKIQSRKVNDVRRNSLALLQQGLRNFIAVNVYGCNGLAKYLWVGASPFFLIKPMGRLS
jgi:hypothetical protein